MKKTRLTDVWGDSFTTGIFNELDGMEVPWEELDISSELDIVYFGTNSGDKVISPLVEKILGDNDELTSGNKTTLATVALSMFGENWRRRYEVMTAEYDPIENYNMTESESGSTTTGNSRTHGGTTRTADTGTDTMVHSGTVADAHTGTIGDILSASRTVTNNSDIYGFNSSTAVHDRVNGGTETDNTASTRTLANTDTTTYNNSDTRTLNTTETITHGETINDTGGGTSSRTLTRSGNIGVTTSEQMLTSQIELWKWNYFLDVFRDIDTLLTSPIY